MDTLQQREAKSEGSEAGSRTLTGWFGRQVKSRAPEESASPRFHGEHDTAHVDFQKRVPSTGAVPRSVQCIMDWISSTEAH